MTIHEYRSNPSKYTFQITPGPYPDVAKTEVINIKVEQPEGEIKVKVYTPTDDAAQKGGLKTAAGLPAHVNYHGGVCLEMSFRTGVLFADHPLQEDGLLAV